MKRKGLGKGLGQGYKNLLPSDSFIHRLNRLGIKSIRLPVETAIVVPSTEAENKPISKPKFQKRVDNTRKELSDMFGGFTSVSALGGYVGEKEELVKEKVNVVTAFASEESYEKNKENFINYVNKKKEEWEQEAVSIMIENDLIMM
jgi:hypothetical protein